MHTKTNHHQTKTTADTASPDKSHMRHLSHAKKKQLELGDQMEHEHGVKRELLEHAVEDLDED